MSQNNVNRPEEKNQASTKPVKAKKSLTPEQQQRRRKIMAMPVFIIIFLAAMYLIFSPTKSEKAANPASKGFNVDVPDPEADKLYDNKEDAYVREEINEEMRKRQQSLWDFAGQTRIEIPESDPTGDQSSGGAGKNNLQKSTDAYRAAASQLSDFYQPAKEPENAELVRKVEELSRKLEESKQNGNMTTEELMERSYRMAGMYLNPQPEVVPTPEPEREVLDVRAVGDKTASALAQDISNETFLAEIVRERNYGFNTAVGSSYKTSKNTFNACIAETQTIENGHRVKMRLLEPLQAGNVIIPANNPITGNANIQGDRLDIVIHNIEYAGNILPVQLMVYDVDGQMGIFVPDSQDRSAAKEAVAAMGENAGTTVSVSQNAGQQVAMDLTRGVVQGGTRFLSRKIRTVRVELKAGYKILLVTKEN